MKTKVLLLDVDYTVINTDSMIDFMLYSLRIRPFKTLIKLPYIFITLILYAVKLVSLNKAKEAVFYPIVDYTEEDIEIFFNKVLQNKINSNMRKIIDKAKEEQAFILMITASPYAYMKYFKKYGYADEVIGTTLEFKDGKYINHIIGNNCKGKEKITKISEVLEREQIEIDYDDSYAYSDSKSDIPMLSLVANGYLVNKKDGTVKEKLNLSKV